MHSKLTEGCENNWKSANRESNLGKWHFRQSRNLHCTARTVRKFTLKMGIPTTLRVHFVIFNLEFTFNLLEELKITNFKRIPKQLYRTYNHFQLQLKIFSTDK